MADSRRVFSDETAAMQRALELALQGQGQVEPNPCVGAVITNDRLELLGEGWHERFGGPHAEVQALRQAGEAARGGTLFVTLEPCNHQGKTPPCSEAVLAAGIRRVFAAVEDPAAHNQGQGFARLRQAGVEVHVGLCAKQGHALLAPFQVCRTQGRAYVHAKWAMTLDGKLATRTGHSQWISNAESRQRVHALRGRMDAILVGIGTVLQDDPLLTARPAGGRVPCRVVLDSQARLPVSSQLVQTACEVPVLLIVGAQADPARLKRLQAAGVEVLALPNQTPGTLHGGVDLLAVLKELAVRGGTNVLIEGGGSVLGSAWDAGLIDEVHCFVAPKLAGGQQACSPIAGLGLETIPEQASLMTPRIEVLGDNVYFHGQVRRND